MRSVTGQNQNENAPTKYQPGGTALLAVNEISEYCKKLGTDFRKLGRWSWFTLQGSTVHRTRIESAYHVGKAKPPGLQSYYHQQRRHIQLHDLRTTPYDFFCSDLIRQLKIWMSQGYRILLMMGANEHVTRGVFGKDLEDIGLFEASHVHWGCK